MSAHYSDRQCKDCRHFHKAEQQQRGAVQLGQPVKGECRERKHLCMTPQKVPGGQVVMGRQIVFLLVNDSDKACAQFDEAAPWEENSA